jgi:hypothetical protein
MTNLRTPLLLIALVALSGCILPRFDPECAETSDCDECIKDDGCGFCDSDVGDGRCVPGTALGPDDYFACAPQSWRIGDCYSTPDWAECDNYSCTSCVADQGCGWCAATEECWPTDDPPPTCFLVTDGAVCSW